MAKASGPTCPIGESDYIISFCYGDIVALDVSDTMFFLIWLNISEPPAALVLVISAVELLASGTTIIPI